MKEEYKLLVIFLFMQQWIVQIHGHTLNFFSLMSKIFLMQWQAVLQMVFLLMVSFGEILFIAGNIIKIQDMIGGYLVQHIVFVYMMQCVLTISEDLMNIFLFLMVQNLQKLDTGKRVLVQNCFAVQSSVLAGMKLLQKIQAM